jgi:DHA1 family tetracycline resistance protein-like MFS transporter
MTSAPKVLTPDPSARPEPTDQAGPVPTRGSLLVIFLTVFIDLLGFGMVLPLLPIYAASFGVTEGGWVIALLMSSFSAMQFLFAPLWGKLSDRVGRRPVLIVGLAASSLFYFLFGLAALWQSLAWLFVARIGAGIAGATISTASAYIADVTTHQTRAKGMALIGAAFGLGFTFGPLIGAAALLFSEGTLQVGASPWPGYAAAILSAGALLLALFLLPESLLAGHGHSQHALLDLRAWHDALAMPSIPALLLTSLVSVLSFGAFETTLSLLLKRELHFAFHQVLLYFAFIGLTLTLAQGLLVRRLSGRVGEVALATAGSIVTIAGFLFLTYASRAGSVPLLMAASAVEVTGFSLMTPSVQSLISRRSDPARQGAIMGVAQSVSALARIFGPLISIPLFFIRPTLPYWTAAVMMAAAMAVFLLFARHGKDYGPPAEVPLVLE